MSFAGDIGKAVKLVEELASGQTTGAALLDELLGGGRAASAAQPRKHCTRAAACVDEDGHEGGCTFEVRP